MSASDSIPTRYQLRVTQRSRVVEYAGTRVQRSPFWPRTADPGARGVGASRNRRIF